VTYGQCMIATIPVTPGETLYVYVGGSAANLGSSSAPGAGGAGG